MCSGSSVTGGERGELARDRPARALPRQTTCRSGRTRMRSYPYTSRGASSSIVSTSNGAPRGAHRALEARGVGGRASEAQQSIPVADPIVHRRAVAEPDVRQPRARPRRRHVLAKEVLGPARFVDHNRGADISIAEFGANHLVRLALLDVGRPRQGSRASPAPPASPPGYRAGTAHATCAARATHTAKRPRCGRRPGAVRSRTSAAGSARPTPAASPASFQDRSIASPTPVFMPRPPVGITRCAESPARNTRPAR